MDREAVNYLEARRFGWLREDVLTEQVFIGLQDLNNELESSIIQGHLFGPLESLLEGWKHNDSVVLSSALLHCLHFVNVPGSPRSIRKRVAAKGGSSVQAALFGIQSVNSLIGATTFGKQWQISADLPFENLANLPLIEWIIGSGDDPKAALLAIILTCKLARAGHYSLAWKLWHGAVEGKFSSGVQWWIFCEIRRAEGIENYPEEALQSDHAILRSFIIGGYEQLKASAPSQAKKWARLQLECEPHCGVDRVLSRRGPLSTRWAFSKRLVKMIKLMPRVAEIEYGLNPRVQW